MNVRPSTAAVEGTPRVAAVDAIGAPADGEGLAASRGLMLRTAHGFLWMIAQTVSTKVFTLGSQIALAWFLDREDFGVVSKAFTATAFPALVYQIGVREVLVRRQASIWRWSSTAYWVSAAFGLASAALMLAVAPFAAWFNYGTHAFAQPETSRQAWKLVYLIGLISISAPFVPLASVATAALERQLRFRALSLIAFLNASGIAALSVLFAALHCGAYSFVLPWPIIGFARLVVLYRLVPSSVRRNPQLRRWKYLIGDGTLVLLARGLGTFVVVGDYLMLGRFHSERVLGIYFFAFNLSMQSMILLALNMEGVVFPALSKIRHDPGAQHRLLMQTVRSVGLLGVPACLLQAALAAPGIWAVFDPKWAPAIPVLQVLSIGMAFRIIGWPAGSMLLAQGRYKTMVATAAGGAVSFMAIVSVASACSPERNAATVVAIAVASYFAIEAPIRLYIASGASINEVYRAFAVPMLLGATAVACGFGAAYLLPEMRLVHWARIGVTVLVAVALYGAALRYLAPGSLEAIRRQLGRTATVPIRQRPTHVSEEITGEATTCSPCLGKPLPRLANGVRRVTP